MKKQETDGQNKTVCFLVVGDRLSYERNGKISENFHNNIKKYSDFRDKGEWIIVKGLIEKMNETG